MYHEHEKMFFLNILLYNQGGLATWKKNSRSFDGFQKFFTVISIFEASKCKKKQFIKIWNIKKIILKLINHSNSYI